VKIRETNRPLVSGWSSIIEHLQKSGYNVTAPRFPHTSLADNLVRLREVLADQTGPTILAGHFYGSQIPCNHHAIGVDCKGCGGQEVDDDRFPGRAGTDPVL
jgi:hypothetical protein